MIFDQRPETSCKCICFYLSLGLNNLSRTNPQNKSGKHVLITYTLKIVDLITSFYMQ